MSADARRRRAAGAVAAKASFHQVYDLPDPRGYFSALGALDYREPHHGQRVFSALLRALAPARGPGAFGPPVVLDLCCSYGVNAALLTCDLTLADLEQRYRDRARADLSAAELLAQDRRFYARRRRAGAPVVLGVDTAAGAVAYARDAGLLAAGWAEDLETAEPSPGLAAAMAGVDLVTITGGVGYVTEVTLDRLLRAAARAGRLPWVAAFVVRMYPYEAIAEVLAAHGLVTERAAGTFPRRRFVDAGEQARVLDRLAEAGIDATGREADGWYHSWLCVSRPADVARGAPVDTLLAGGG